MKFKALVLLAVLTCTLQPICQCDRDPVVELQVREREKKVDVLIDGELFTSYIYPDNLMKPVLWPVFSPGGNLVTRSFPLADKEGERTDHRHHVGVWLNYGDVNGFDFWNNSEAIPAEQRGRYGTIYHTSIRKAGSAGGSAVLETTAEWRSPEQGSLLEEETRFTFTAHRNMRIIDRTTILTAVMDTVKFTDNKEGMFGIRVARELELPTDEPPGPVEPHGNYRSAGGVEGKEVWGTRSRWMKLAGGINGENVALVIIDHPGNVGYPTHWHARDYGLFAANTLGQKIFSDGRLELNFRLLKGESVTFRYRLVVAGENLTDERINQLADEFAEM